MSLENRLSEELQDFETKTEGILGSCVVSTGNALMMAEASSAYDRDVIQAIGVKIISLSNDTLNLIFDNPSLSSVTIEEVDHFLYVRRINSEYHVVVLTDRSEAMGLREINIKELIKRLQKTFD